MTLVWLVCTGGCCALPWRCPSDDRVIAAREQARIGLESLHRGRLPEAQSRLTNALGDCPNDASIRHDLALVYWKQGEHEQAIEEMDMAIRHAEKQADWIVEMGNMLLARGEIAGALESAERALEMNCELGSAWHLRGDVRRHQEQIDQATNDYHRALSCSNVDSGPLLLKLADVYRSQQRHRRALATLHRYMDDTSSETRPPFAYFLVADSMQANGQHEEAIAMFEESLRNDGPRTNSLLGLARSHWQLGDRERALQWAATAAESNPTDPRVAALVADLGQPAAHLASGVRPLSQ